MFLSTSPKSPSNHPTIFRPGFQGFFWPPVRRQVLLHSPGEGNEVEGRRGRREEGEGREAWERGETDLPNGWADRTMEQQGAESAKEGGDCAVGGREAAGDALPRKAWERG